MALEVGTTAPEVSGTLADGSRWSTADARGKTLVLYFYPKDFTPGCTREACGFRDVYDDLAAEGVEIVGVSRDSSDSHARFASKHGLPFKLLADESGEITKAYEATLFGGLLPVSKRITYVIDRDGVVRGVFSHTLDATRHVSDVQRLIAELGRAARA
jgi:peroxiredoxin Q/BCP